MKKLILLLFSLFSLNLFATHIVGGEMNYEYIGNDQYIIRLTVYRDCSVTTAYDNPANVGIFDVNNNLIQEITLPFLGSSELVPNFNVPCGVAPTNVCVETTTYIDTLTLPPIAGGYRISYQRCCRNNSIINIQDPGDTGATYSAFIPGIANAANSNPVITNPPPVYACASLPLSLNFSATDKEGDSLVYNLCIPNDGASSLSPQPTPGSFTTANPVVWETGYSLGNIMNSTPPLAINSQTGVITGTPNALGQYVFSVCVDEYRNGVYIGTTTRDMQLNVVDCQITVISAFTTPTGTCGNDVSFTNSSSGATSYFWDFGVSGTNADTSNIAEPTFTFPGAGTYTVTLIAQDPNGAACNDTLEVDVTVNPPYVINAGPDVSFCSGLGAVIGPQGSLPGVTFSWSPGTSLSSTTAQNPQASPSQTSTYIVTATNAEGCIATDSVTVFVGQFPTSVVDTSLSADCDGWLLTLSTPTLDTSSYSVTWVFTLDSTVANGPTVVRNFNFGDTTSVTVYLVDPSGGCSDTLVLNDLLPPTGTFFTLPVPNIFTPNGDAFNECFKPNILPGFEECYTMVIYNRWGIKVFETDADNTCWNGKIKSDGANASDGVYYYIMDFKGTKYNGYVMLATGK
ncbi:MAG: gliding motility-associated C-terminal domain-containing protein [Sphingobacteriales bacterium JAD_PAG50586_3]|nr:MAG: gliding motility-associated C-terminal domain-containing protein [Sphingobacteriales bacterium JAD_PAG50586_3]